MDQPIHDELYDLLARHLMGQLTSEESVRLDKILIEHPELQQHYYSLLQRRDLTARYKAYRAAADSKDAVKQKFLATLQPARSADDAPKHRPTLALWRWVASVAAVITVAWVLWPSGADTETKNQQQSAVATATHSQPTVASSGPHPKAILPEASLKGESEGIVADSTTALSLQSLAAQADMQAVRHENDFWLTLSDGTRVHLSYNSQLTYPVTFSTADKREVWLEGDAYFAIAADPVAGKRADRPFIVHTPQGEVRDYGTEFDVSTQGGQTQVVLLSGKVGVAPSGQRETMLRPGQKAVWTTSAGVRLTAVDTAPFRAWNADRYSFDDCTLADLMMVLSRWYGFHVTYSHADLSHQRFSGILSRRTNANATLHAISAIADLKMTMRGSEVIIGE